ncbi:MAG: hypothetical protein FWG39_00650 [Alphaproteobacteria bacterium]|nr:hypothetical protein [Alphaproteobacteria bacterium]
MISSRVYLCALAFVSFGFLHDAFASAALPAVNPGHMVSAREAFGMPPKPAPAPVAQRAPRVIARAAVPVTPVPAPVAAENNSTDILTPRRPNDNLWARAANNDAPWLARGAAVPVPIAAAHAPAPSAEIIPVPARPMIEFPDDFELPEERLFARKVSVPAIVPAPAISFQPTIKPSPDVAASVPEFVPAPIENNDIAFARVEIPFDDFKGYKVNDDSVIAAVTDNGQRTTDNDDVPLNKLSPMQLRRAFQKTYISENKHLSTYKIDDRFDVASDMSVEMQGFDSARDLTEQELPRPLEIRIGFRGDDAALSRDNFQLLSDFAGLVVRNPKRAIQISIPERSVQNIDGRRLAARRLAIVEQALKDSNVSDNKIMPVLSGRESDAFVLRVISTDSFQTLVEKQRDIFGDTVSTRTQRSLSW